VGSVTYPLPPLFMVMATQNPIEQEGTYPLPEAQLDRFLLHVLVNYPDAAGERVFDIRDLNELTLEGTAGQSVVVEVRRDGQQVQLVMPRGPLGISGGFRGGRGPPVR